MKNKLKIISAIIILALSFVVQSCSKDEVYSCNKEINKWVKNNYKDVREMTRTDWVRNGDITYQRAIYNAFSPEQKINLWIEKFEDALDLFSSNEEKAHLKLLSNTIKNNPQWFDNSMNENQDDFDLFIYQWAEYAKINLGWNAHTMDALIATPENIIRTESGTIAVQMQKKQITRVATMKEGGGYGKVCDCGDGSLGWQCHVLLLYTCELSDCTRTAKGCGALWAGACWGTCV